MSKYVVTNTHEHPGSWGAYRGRRDPDADAPPELTPRSSTSPELKREVPPLSNNAAFSSAVVPIDFLAIAPTKRAKTKRRALSRTRCGGQWRHRPILGRRVLGC